ncbi:MAG TPA: F0F1 ATP synthase subunit epsilon [Candidatus Gastranaerophilales bacterium]|nr:F0F1 ATP synthase subunit epsilon [Candidatus Gastranaerophilales bacterium]
MTKKLNLKIITPQKILVDEQVDSVFSKSIDGEFGILPDHVSYMTDLAIGVTEYRKDNKKEFISTMGGVIQVKENTVTIISDTAEPGEQIDIPRARAAKERAEARLRTGAPDIDANRAQVALARAIARMQAASKKR